MTQSVLGVSLSRRDTPLKITGEAQYTADLTLPGQLVARVLRSPLPHARVLRVDVSRARALPGVQVVLTGADVAAHPQMNTHWGPVLTDQPLLALDRVRHVGDPVAAVAAVDAATAERALDLIAVDYDPLPAVMDAEAAMAPGAPLLHDLKGEQDSPFPDLAGHVHPVPGTNACNHFVIGCGDVAAGFVAADLVVEGTYQVPAVQHCPMETHAVLVRPEPNGSLTVWSNTQTPSLTRMLLARLFRRPTAAVRVIVPYLGGGFGAKVYPHIEPIACALALAARRPVKWVLSREEEFITITRHGATVWLKTGVKADGRIVARQARILWNTGAYADVGPRVAKNASYLAMGPYVIPHARADSYAVYTNCAPAGAFRGYGSPQVSWGGEQQIDDIAARLGLDPVALRHRNLLREGSVFCTGDVIRGSDFGAVLDTVAAGLGDGAAATGRVRGRGVACVLKSTGTPSASAATVRVNDDGSATLLVSSVEMGQGVHTALAQVCAEALGLPADQVTVVNPDTDVTPYDQSTSSSRTTFHMGNAILQAAADVRAQLANLGAAMLECAPADVEMRDGAVIVRGAPDRRATFGQIVQKRFGMSGGTLFGEGFYKSVGGLQAPPPDRRVSVFWFAAAAAAEVEVDTDTGEITVLHLVGATDAGKVVNPLLATQQTHGSITMALGATLFEEMLYADGQPVNASLLTYKIPTIQDMPDRCTARFVETPHPEGPYGAKGIGEPLVGAVAPAVANAVFNATGIRVHDLPLTPEKVLRALRREETPWNA